MLRLAPEIQQHILSMSDTVHRTPVTERALRPVAQLDDSSSKLREFQKTLSDLGPKHNGSRLPARWGR